jgi:hypothetical protein
MQVLRTLCCRLVLFRAGLDDGVNREQEQHDECQNHGATYAGASTLVFAHGKSSRYSMAIWVDNLD